MEPTTLSPTRATLLVACAGVLLAQLDTSVVNLIVRELHDAFDANAGVLRWFVDGYNLAYATAILSAGALGDRLGRRRVFVIGLVVFTVGSAACAFAPNAGVLIAARVLTGIGAALEVPATLALLSVAFPDGAARAGALGWWASMNGLAFAIGPVLGGVLADALGWRSVFAVAIPVALATLAVVSRVPESGRQPNAGLDLWGQLLAAVALGAFTFAGMALGSRSFATAGPWLALAVLATIVFIVRERTARRPLVDLALFRDRPFLAATLCTGCMTFGMYGLLFLTPFALQTLRGIHATAAGLALLPLSVVFVVVSSRSAAIVGRLGQRLTIALGLACMGAGCVCLCIDPGTQWPLALIGLAFAGIGLGLTTGPVLGYAVKRAPDERAGVAAGIGNASRMLGATLGVAIVGAAAACVTLGHVGTLRWGYAGSASVEMLGAIIALLGIRDTTAPVTSTP
jgi:EmrB/QacA subfamily drug resistance transporter